MVELGYNYRLTDLQCALAASQIEKPAWLARRERSRRVQVCFRRVPGDRMSDGLRDRRSAWHLYVIRLNLDSSRRTSRVFRALRAENIGVNVHYFPVPWHPYYAQHGYVRGSWPLAESGDEALDQSADVARHDRSGRCGHHRGRREGAGLVRRVSIRNRLALGTVQFGLPNGIANDAGQVSYCETAAILQHAWAAGLDTLDTASAYGVSERRLGDIGIGQWQVISKLSAIPERCTDVAAWVRGSVRSALDRLRVPRLHGLLLHRPVQLLGPQGRELYGALLELKNHGTVDKIGISIYGPDELDDVWPHFALDLVQAPFNVIDRRLATSGWLARLHACGTEVHVRSVFLQGLLVMEARRRPVQFNRWRILWEEWSRWLDGQGLTPAQACLGVAWAESEIDRIVVGVDRLDHLQDILAVIDAPAVVPPATLMSDDPYLINPSRWAIH